LLEYLTSEQISEWEAFNELEPIGDVRQDIHNANLIAWIVNTARCMVPRKRGSPPPKMMAPAEALLKWYEDDDQRDIPQAKQPMQEMKNILLRMARDSKGKLRRRKKPLPIVSKKKQQQKKSNK
jgi:hypothetical protein